MATAPDSSKKHRLRSKNEVVQLNDFFEELNEEYEEELRMRQNSGSQVDETALLGDREIPFQFEEEDEESDSGADDSASDTGSVASEGENGGSDSGLDAPVKQKRLRGSSDVVKRKDSIGPIKITTKVADPPAHHVEPVKPESPVSVPSAPVAATPASANTAAPVSKDDAVAAVQRSTSFVGSQGNSRPSVVNKLRSFWESAQPATAAQPGPALTRTTSVSASASQGRPASVSMAPAPVVTPAAAPSAASSGAAGVKKWAPVDARPAMATAISVPGDRSTVASNSMVRAYSVVGLPQTGRNTSPAPNVRASQNLSPAQPSTQRVETSPRRGAQSSPATAPAVTAATALPAATPVPVSPAHATTPSIEKAVETPEQVTVPATSVQSEPAIETKHVDGTLAEPVAASANGVENHVDAVPAAAAEPVDPPQDTAHIPAAAKVDPQTETTANDTLDLTEAAIQVVDSPTLSRAAPTETAPASTVAQVSPTKGRRPTRTDSDGKKDKVADTPAADSPASTPPEKRTTKRRNSEKRKKAPRTDSEANDSGTEDSGKKKRTKKASPPADASEDDAGANDSGTDAEIKTKRRRKKLTSTTPGGTPTKRVSTKKIKKTASSAEQPKADAANDAQRDAALASAGVAPKEIDKLKQFFATWNSKDLMHTWEIDPTEIEFVERIGEGTSCSVYRGTYRGQEVALKVLKDINQKQLTNFTKEFDIISQFRSPYAVFFFGACIEPIPVMVLGFCRKGSLFHVLNNPNENITWDLVLKICLQTMRGLDSLHNWRPQIVHRDLKSRNILVEDDWNTKLCDFGESRYTQGTNLETLCKVRGTYAYIAPEVYFGQSFTPKSDVYAFGIILWELCNRFIKGKYEAPFSEYKSLIYDFQIIVQASRKGLRPSIDPKVPQALQNVIRACWDHEPENRPETSSILHFFEEIIAEPNQKKWLEVKHAPVYPPANGVGKAGAAPKTSGDTKS